jgi:hypothetical protein
LGRPVLNSIGIERQCVVARSRRKSIRLDAVSGFRPYGEASIKFTLDQSGHIALNSIYKLGSQPPTFQYVNSVQSGLLFIY